MERICTKTWEWGDYIPEVWDDWLADENGVLLIGELDDQAVGLSRITFQTPGQVWLEGMRVHPDFRQQGIAARFLDYSLDYARTHKARVVRLGTDRDNAPAHTVVARAGMECVGRYVLWVAEPLPEASPPPVLTPQHEAAARTFLEQSRVWHHTHYLYNANWAWQELSGCRIQQMLSSGQMVVQWASDGKLAALAIIHSDAEDGGLWIGFADGIHGEQESEQPSPITTLASAVRGLAAKIVSKGAEAEQVRIMLTDLDWLQEAFRNAGYGPGKRERELCIFERRFGHHLGDTDVG
jgi:GNAT superfamily N-acetyltransferase